MSWLGLLCLFVLSSLVASDPVGYVEYDETERIEPVDSSCSLYVTHLEVSLPGCLPEVIRTWACRGTCHSWALPKWVPEDSHSLVTRGIHMVHNCKCCKPLNHRAQVTTLNCPGRGGFIKRPIMVPIDCRCRPCSDIPAHSVKTFDY